MNTLWRPADRRRFEIDLAGWDARVPGAGQLEEYLTALLRDLGAGLGIGLYEEAVTHCFGGPGRVEADVAVEIGGRAVGRQRFRLIGPGVGLKITGLDLP